MGPTAIGKTKLAIAIANHFGTDILSCDSRQFYKEMSIGTAKPTKDELSKTIHHFIGNISINDSYTAGMYEREALELIEQLHLKKDVVVLTGGSGLFERAVVEGFDDIPVAPLDIRDSIESDLKSKGLSYLQDQLKQLDNETYNSIDIKNPRRVQRALEIIHMGGKASELKNKTVKERPFRTIRIGLNMDRESLYERINTRVDEMMTIGLEKEARSLFEFSNLQALQTVGYKELFDYFENNSTMDEAVELIKRNTRRYAKRQLTWFRKYEDLKWFHPEQVEEIIKYINTRITKEQ